MSATMMKAVRQHAFGGPDVLLYEDAPVPQLQAGEVLVRVHAVGVNPPDWYLRDGYKMLPPAWRPTVTFPLILGSDIAGVIAAVAADVHGFAVGDAVFGMVKFPSTGASAAYAEYVAAPASDLAIKPANIDHIHAAAVPMAGLTAWQYLIELGHDVQNPFQPMPHRPVALAAGKTVLVNGAAGGVGHMAVQLAKWQGARVIAVASGKHTAFLRDLGADDVIDYTQTPAEDVARDVDVVLDTLTGPTSARFLRTLKRGGMMSPVFLGFDGADEAAARAITVSMTQVRSNGAQLAQLATLLENGTIKVAIDSTFLLADAGTAHARAAQGHIQGKIVLRVA